MLETRLRTLGGGASTTSSTGTSGIVYAPTGGSYVVFEADASLVLSKILSGGANVTITTDATAIFVAATTGAGSSGVTAVTATSPIVSSGGTAPAISINQATSAVDGYITSDDWETFNAKASSAGNYITFLADAGLSNDKVLTASNNILITTAATTVYLTALTGAPITYAPTGGNYIAFLADANLSNEKVLTASNNILITTAATTVYLTALTGAEIVYASSSNSYVTVTAAADLTNEFVITASNNIQITTAAGIVYLSALTGAAGSSIVYASTGSYYILTQTDGSLPNSKLIAAGANISVTTNASTITISATTGAAGAGGNVGELQYNNAGALAGVSTANYIDWQNRYLKNDSNAVSYDWNINRWSDKVFTFFSPGNLSTTAISGNARVYIPHVTSIYQIRLAVMTSSVGSDIIVNVNQYGTPNGSVINANSGSILQTYFSGSHTAIGNPILYTGSYLGIDIGQVGSTVSGSNLTVTIISRSS